MFFFKCESIPYLFQYILYSLTIHTLQTPFCTCSQDILCMLIACFFTCWSFIPDTAMAFPTCWQVQPSWSHLAWSSSMRLTPWGPSGPAHRFIPTPTRPSTSSSLRWMGEGFVWSLVPLANSSVCGCVWVCVCVWVWWGGMVYVFVWWLACVFVWSCVWLCVARRGGCVWSDKKDGEWSVLVYLLV